MLSTAPSTHPSAAEFLRQLILFIDSRGSELLSSKAAFKLQPRALEYLALRLDGLRELQRVKTSNPIRFLAGAVADLTDFLRMEKVQQFCSLARHLKLYSASQDVRDPTPINFSPFASITTLEIRGCDLSSCSPRAVEVLRPTVERIICQNSLESLWHLLNPDLDSEAKWTKLNSFSCIYNDLTDIDLSLHTTRNLTVLDLSRNQIKEAQNLSQLEQLNALDLSFNFLGSLGEIPSLSGLVRLFLQSNGIRSLDRISSLVALEELDLKWNVLSVWSDIVKLRELSHLRAVSLDGNPLSAAPNYRVHALACLEGELEEILLDGKPVSEVEARKVKKLVIHDDGSIEESTNEHVVLPAAPYIYEFLFPFWKTSRHSRFESLERLDSAPLLIAEEGSEIDRKAKAPVKTIVDIPITSYIPSAERSGELSSRLASSSSTTVRNQASDNFDVVHSAESLSSV